MANRSQPDDRFGFHDDQNMPPVLPCPSEPDPKHVVRLPENRSARAPPLEDVSRVSSLCSFVENH